MSFFEPPPPLPERPPPPPRKPWHGPPSNEFGVPLGIGVVLARTRELALALTDVVAYAEGFVLKIGLRAKATTELDPRTVMMGDSLRFGVAFADGRKAVSYGRPGAPDDEAPAVALRRAGAGGGGSRGFEFAFWVYPLPPEGPVTVALEWPERGVAETLHELDGAAIAAAGARSEQLWEEDGGWRGPAFSTQVAAMAPRPDARPRPPAA